MHRRNNDPSSPPPRVLLVTAAQAARLLSISGRHLWTLTRRGEIPCRRVGHAVRYYLRDLEHYASGGTAQEARDGE